MITLNVREMYVEINDLLMGATRVAYNPKDIIIDILYQLSEDKEPSAIAPFKELYNLHREEHRRDKITDEKLLREVYGIAVPVVKKIIKENFPFGISFNCAMAVRGFNIIILTGKEIEMWEKIYGTKQISWTYARDDSQKDEA